MGLSEREQALWLAATSSFDDETDPIMLAADDFRTVRAASSLVVGRYLEQPTDLDTYYEQVGSDYMLSEHETRVALGLAKDRLTRD